VAVVTDNAANMKAAWKFVETRFPHVLCVGCASHGIHLLVKDFLNLPLFQTLFKKCDHVVSYFSNHHIPKSNLEDQQQRHLHKIIALHKYT